MGSDISYMAFSQTNNLIVRGWGWIVGDAWPWKRKEKKNLQLHIKCAQAFHGLSNLGVICDARKTHRLISWVMCARVDACACMC